jgi:hypothetical protein
VDNGVGFGPWVSLVYNSLPSNSSSEIVEIDSALCNSATMLRGIAAGMFDIAVHPILMDSDCDGCTWSYPLSANGLVMVSGLESERSDIYFTPFTTNAWFAIGGMMMVTVTSIFIMEWKRDGWASAPHALLTMAANMHRTDTVRAPAYILYITLAVCSTLLIALYSATLTSTVLQEKALIGNNVKKVIASKLPFSVVAGGPVTQMTYEFPETDYYSTVTADAADQALPCLMLWEQGERLVSKSCDPLVSVSGAINRIPYSMAFRAGTDGAAWVNDEFRKASLSDAPQASMLSWIQQRYTCVEERAIRLDSRTMEPLLWVSIGVYTLAAIAKIMTACRERYRARSNNPQSLVI